MRKKLKNIKQKHSVTTETQEHAIGKITIVRKKSFTMLKSVMKCICLIFVIGIVSLLMTIWFLRSNFFTTMFNKKLASDNSTSIINTQYNNLIFNAIEKTTPSLVAITNKKVSVFNTGNLDSDVKRITGVAVREDGYIVTSYSAIKDFKEIYVNVPNVNDKSFKATLVGGDDITNIAVLKINFNKLVPISTAAQVTQGESIFAVGNTLGEESSSVATMGIVSNPDKLVNMVDKYKMNVKTGVIESDLNIGNATDGGVLVNIQGQVVGFNTFENTKENSLAKSVSVKYAGDVISQIIHSGDVQRIFVGINGVSSTSPEGGYNIQEIEKSGCAYKAGIRIGDTIYEISNQKMNSINDIVKVLKNAKINEVVPVVIIRDGKKIDINMKLTPKEG